ncbi:MAG: hemolysin family protein [Actinobacteria bacterium]|nr:hemolysin family protein [Actinomycetota bacterium]
MTPPITDSIPLLVTLAVLVAVAAFLGAAEAALLRVPQVRAEVLGEQGDRAARRVARLAGDLTHTMNAVLLLVLLVQVAAATIAGVVAERHFGNTGVTVASVVLTLVMFVYAEAIPKTLAIRRPLQTARVVAAPVAVLAAAVRPVVSLLVWLADLQAPGRGVETGVSVGEAELIRLAAKAEAEGSIESTDREFIERAFLVGDLRIREIMVPRPDVVAVAGTATVREALDAAVAAGHRRLPVFEGGLDRIVGMVRMRDLAPVVTEEPERRVAELALDVLVVPETRRLVDVLRDMQRGRTWLAAVIDEFGGTAGIATIEDIVEELVGDIADEDVAPVPEIRPLGPGRWAVDGTADLRDLREVLGGALPEGDWLTAGGMVMGVTGRIPARGDAVEVPGFRIEVTAATRRRVRRLEITALDG